MTLDQTSDHKKNKEAKARLKCPQSALKGVRVRAPMSNFTSTSTVHGFCFISLSIELDTLTSPLLPVLRTTFFSRAQGKMNTPDGSVMLSDLEI
uniref:Uncharacterized protein n=1 Tax=Panagrellus redivivus TaxID=6233 RepID=A0A7E4UT67_PANRE